MGFGFDDIVDFAKHPLGESVPVSAFGLTDPVRGAIEVGGALLGRVGGSSDDGSQDLAHQFGAENFGGSGLEMGEAQSAAFEAQQRFFDVAAAAQEELAERSRFLFGVFENDFLPGIQEIGRAARDGVPVEPRLAAATADVQQAFQRSSEIAQRELARFGISPTSPRAVAGQRDVQLARSAAEVGARNLARRGARAETEQRRLQAANLGLNFPSLAQGAQALGLQSLQAGAAGLEGPASREAALQRQGLDFSFQASENAADRALRQREIELRQQQIEQDARRAAQQNRLSAITDIASLGALFIPGAGPAVSAGIQALGPSSGQLFNPGSDSGFGSFF